MANEQLRASGYDALDYAIINALAEHPEISNKALAQKVQVAESTCTYRLRRLREAQIIGPRRFEIDYARLGYPLKAVVMVFLARHSREVVDEFANHVSTLPNVLSVVSLTGRADFLVTVAVKNGEQLGDFVLDHVTKLPSVRGTESHIIFGSREGTWIPSPSATES